MTRNSWNESSETGMMAAQPPRHALRAPEPTPGLDPTGEPVIIAHAVTVILGALVTAGWIAVPNTLIDAIGTGVALVLATVGAVLARARVSPLSGGLWQAIGAYVAELVAEEVARHPVAVRQPPGRRP